MPVTKSAKKALRRDRRRAVVNKKIIQKVKAAIKKFRQNPTKKALGEVYKAIDRTAKKKVFHKNKAARLKSRLAKLVTSIKKRKKEPKKSPPGMSAKNP
jgi:small subunit ribosomal protein S20